MVLSNMDDFPSYTERKKIINFIEVFISEHNIKNPGVVTLITLDWFQRSVKLHYNACCGEKVEDKHYDLVEKSIKNVYNCDKIIWFRR